MASFNNKEQDMEWTKKDILTALDNAVSETFEQIAFLEVCPLAPEEATGAEGLRWVRIPLGCPLDADFRLGCPPDLLSEVAETVFCGMEFPEDMDVHGDALAELANMIAGAFLSHLAPDETGIDVGLPEALEGGAAAALAPCADGGAEGGDFCRLFGFDDGRQIRLGLVFSG